MVFNYSFWKFAPRPGLLGRQMKQATPRKLTWQILGLFLFALILFSVRNVLGFGTESFTSLIVTEGLAPYSLARLLSLIGVMIGSLLYVWFLIYGMAFILSAFTNISFEVWKPVQLSVTAMFLLALLIDTLFQLYIGVKVKASIFSFGVLGWVFSENEMLNLLLNQLSIPLFLAVFIQYQFARNYDEENSKSTLFIIMVIYLFLILIVSAVGVVPFDEISKLLLGGVY